MENIKIFAGKYYLSSIVKTDNLDNYLSWMKNPLENQYILSAKNSYSIEELRTFIDICNKDENTILLGIYDKIDDNHIGNIKYDNINNLDKTAYLGILIGEQRYRKIGVAKQTITVSIKWLNENLGIENMLLSVYNSNIHALRLYQKLGFWRISDRGKNGLFMNFNINELKNNDS